MSFDFVADPESAPDYWVERLIKAIHEPFVYSDIDGHKHDYKVDPKSLTGSGIIKRQFAICGFIEPVVTFTQLMN